MAELLHTERLLVRDWTVDDTPAALAVYGQPDVARWLSPALRRVPDETTMRHLLESWIGEQDGALAGTGRWALQRHDDGRLVGGVTMLTMPVTEQDVEMGWQLAPEFWGVGYATEVGRAMARWGFERDLVEVFALVHRRNTRAARTAERIGMEHLGPSDKYHGLTLEVYRMRPDDLVA